MSITTLYNLKFSTGSIFELKFNDLPDTAAKTDRFQWYLILDNHRYNLSFLSATQTTRQFVFELGTIDLDLNNKTLKIHYADNGETVTHITNL